MTDDIVTRLRTEASLNKHRGTPLGFAAMDAAKEIERLQTVVDPEFFMLRGRIDILEREIQRLLAAGDVLTRAVTTNCGDEAWADRALAAYEEARRG